MNISLNTYIPYNRNNYVNFQGAKSRKLLNVIKSTKNYRDLKLTFDEMVNIYAELGYDVILKRGSHATVPLDDLITIPLVIPHGDKYVHPNDLKRLKYVIDGEFKKAQMV